MCGVFNSFSGNFAAIAGITIGVLVAVLLVVAIVLVVIAVLVFMKMKGKKQHKLTNGETAFFTMLICKFIF